MTAIAASGALRRQTIADLLRRIARRLPAKTAIVCGATQWTYAARGRRGVKR